MYDLAILWLGGSIMVDANVLEVAKHPLGLAGMALAFVFGALATKKKMPSWWPASAAVLAGTALLGGLGLAYRQLANDAPATSPAKSEQPAPGKGSGKAGAGEQQLKTGDLADQAEAKIAQEMHGKGRPGKQSIELGDVGAGAKLDIKQKQ